MYSSDLMVLFEPLLSVNAWINFFLLSWKRARTKEVQSQLYEMKEIVYLCFPLKNGTHQEMTAFSGTMQYILQSSSENQSKLLR